MNSAIQVTSSPAVQAPPPSTTFTNANLVAGFLYFIHNLNTQLVSITVFDNNGYAITPKDYYPDTTNPYSTTKIDLTTFGTITGTWTVKANWGIATPLTTSSTVFNRNIRSGTTLVIPDGHSQVVGRYINIIGSGSIYLQGDACLIIR